jgi:hypothetical protein
MFRGVSYLFRSETHRYILYTCVSPECFAKRYAQREDIMPIEIVAVYGDETEDEIDRTVLRVWSRLHPGERVRLVPDPGNPGKTMVIAEDPVSEQVAQEAMLWPDMDAAIAEGAD